MEPERDRLQELIRRHEDLLLDPKSSKEVKELCYDTLVVLGRMDRSERVDLSSETLGLKEYDSNS